MEIYEILKNDHDIVKDLFEQIEDFLKDKNYEEAETVFESLRIELTAHSKAEQEVFYQPLKIVSEDIEESGFEEEEEEGEEEYQAGEAQSENFPNEELIGEAEQEHHVIALLLNELSRMDAQDEDWKMKMAVLQEIVEHHIETEEGEIFEEARKCFSSEEAEMIADNMKDLKEKYKGMIESALAEDIALFNQPVKHPVEASQTSFEQ